MSDLVKAILVVVLAIALSLLVAYVIGNSGLPLWLKFWILA